MALYKLRNNAPDGKTIDNEGQRANIRYLNDMDKLRKLAEKPHCVDSSVFNNQVAPPEKQVEPAGAENQQLRNALVKIEMQKLNHFINKPFANGFYLFKNSKLKMCVTYLLLFHVNQIKLLIFVYRYTFYSLLKDAFGKRVKILYNNNDSFFLHFCVKNLEQNIRAPSPSRRYRL